MSHATSKAAPVNSGPTAGIANPSVRAPGFERQHKLLPRNQALLRIQRKCSCGGAGACPDCLQKKSAPGALTVGPADDAFEREADATADRVMRMPDSAPAPPVSAASLSIQRTCSACEEESIQRKAERPGGAHVSPNVDAAIRGARGGGQPMPPSVRGFFEPRFGANFAPVRVHSDARAAGLASAVNAHAFTVGSDIFFAAGSYQPHSADGRRLLAHELTHTLQQGRGLAAGIQRQDAESTEEITEDEVKKQFELEDASESDDLSEEETEAAEIEGEAIDEEELVREADSGEEEVEVDEVEVPDFDLDLSGGPKCVQLWKEAPEEEEEEKEETFAEQVFEKLLTFAGPTGGLASALGGFHAGKAWGALPLSVRAKAVNLAIDGAIKGVGLLPGDTTLGLLWPWFKAGIEGFLNRLKKLDDGEKVTLFEKMAGIILGLNTKAQLGFSIGMIKGFFIDGVLGIVQMILDMTCFVPRVLKFISAFSRLLGKLPDHMEAVWDAIKDLGASIKSAIDGALDELKELIHDPSKFIEAAKIIYEAGKDKSRELGEKLADALIEQARKPAKTLGRKAGEIVGQAVFEGLLAYLTAGTGAGITALKTGAKQAVKWVAELGKKFFEIAKLLIPIVDDISLVVRRAAKFLPKLFRAVGDKLDQAIQHVIDFFHSILGLCRKGSFQCKIPRISKRHSHKRASKKRCKGKFIPRRGGFKPHDDYALRVTRRKRDYRIAIDKVRRCNFDAKIVNLLVECKTGYGWLANPQMQKKKWFGWAVRGLRWQARRCFATAISCGHNYEWWMENEAAQKVLRDDFKGAPKVVHKP